MRRLFDDPQLPAGLRYDLQRSRAAAQDYPVSEKLLQLRAALSDSSRQPFGQDARDARWADVGERLAWRGSHPGWKLLLIVAVAGTGAVGVQRMLGHAEANGVDASAPPSMAAEAVAAPAAQLLERVEPLQQVVVAPAPAAARVEAVAATSPSTSAATRGERARAGQAPDSKSKPMVVPTPRAPTPGSSSRREIAQLVRIRELLKKDPAAAYELAQRSEREFPSGLLSEEREALAIIALAKTGVTDDARRRANAYFLRYPQSPMREQIEAALAR